MKGANNRIKLLSITGITPEEAATRLTGEAAD